LGDHFYGTFGGFFKSSQEGNRKKLGTNMLCLMRRIGLCVVRATNTLPLNIENKALPLIKRKALPENT
jgi:hypothetical protein